MFTSTNTNTTNATARRSAKALALLVALAIGTTACGSGVDREAALAAPVEPAAQPAMEHDTTAAPTDGDTTETDETEPDTTDDQDDVEPQERPDLSGGIDRIVAPVAPVDPLPPVDPATPAIGGFVSPTVPGEPIDFGPVEGRPLTIVGVELGDMLNFRVAPSPNADIVASYPITLTELDIATLGEAWAAPTGVWWKVNVMGQEAWANQAYLAIRGGSVDIFDQVGPELGVLMAPSLESLAIDVAETRASVDPVSRITIITEAEIQAIGDGGGIGTIFVDVLDIGDHLQKGERLRIDVEVIFDEDTPEPNDIAFVVLNGVESIYLQAH